MNESDLAETLKNVAETINSGNIPDELKNILNSFNSAQNNSTSNDDSRSSLPNIDFEMILKIKSLFDKANSNDDPRANLLRSLKPYLKESRKAKIDQYIQFVNMAKIMEIFNDNGGELFK